MKKEYLSKYYLDAYKIAFQFPIHGIGIMDDERETLALAALESAISNFDPSRNVAFPTYLYKSVKNRLFDFVKKKTRLAKKHQPFSTQIEVPFSPIANDVSDADDSLTREEALFQLGCLGFFQTSNPGLYERLTAAIQTLSPNQQRIVDYLMFPTAALKEYKRKTGIKTLRLTHGVIAKLLPLSYGGIRLEMERIREVLQTIVENSIGEP